MEVANRRVQFNTFIKQNKEIVNTHETIERVKEELRTLRQSLATKKPTYKSVAPKIRQGIEIVESSDFDVHKAIEVKFGRSEEKSAPRY